LLLIDTLCEQPSLFLAKKINNINNYKFTTIIEINQIKKTYSNFKKAKE